MCSDHVLLLIISQIKGNIMKKKLNFLLSLLLIAVLSIGLFTTTASSYENDVVTTSSAILLMNMDTDTVCYSIEPDVKRYASYQSELMTFLVACDRIASPERVEVEVTQAFINRLPHSDGALELFVGKTLTAKDLMGIMLMNSGSDAAYLLADTASGGDIPAFVEEMNRRAAQLGCADTHFVTPGYSESNEHYTTCRDLYVIYKALMKNALFNEIMSSSTYLPSGFEEEKTGDGTTADVGRDYEVTTENSFMNPASPYYFRYATGGKYSYDPTAKANIATTTVYSGKTYLFVAMHGKNSSEENVFADARRMTTWAYLNLSDRKVIDTDDAIASCRVDALWGGYEVSLYAHSSAYKTLPSQYEEEKFSYEVSVPEHTALPVFPGQSIGSALIYYDGEKIDDVNLIASSGEGTSLLNDLARFGMYAVREILPDESDASGEVRQ